MRKKVPPFYVGSDPQGTSTIAPPTPKDEAATLRFIHQNGLDGVDTPQPSKAEDGADLGGFLFNSSILD
jgi:hypothetical protein